MLINNNIVKIESLIFLDHFNHFGKYCEREVINFFSTIIKCHVCIDFTTI